MSLPPRRHAPRDERGAVTIFLVIAVMALFLAIGLAVDGGIAIRADQRATAIAEEAARAGGQQVVFGRARGGAPILDSGAAVSAAEAYVSAAGGSGVASTQADQRGNVTMVHVEVTMSYDTVFWKLIGLNSGSVTGEATARLAYGVTQDQS